MNHHLHIRRALMDDAADILAAHHSAVHTTAGRHYPPAITAQWSRTVDAERINQMREVIAAGRELIHVAVIAGRVRGFGSFDASTNGLIAIYVHPDAGRMGMGAALLAAVEQHARDLGLRFLAMDASVNAEAFYRKHGYRTLARGMHRMASGEDMACVKMRKDLVEAG